VKLAATPGERLERAVYAAAALAGVRGSEPELEKATGVSRNALRRLFAGGEPRGDILRKIADGLETTTPEALLAAREGRSPEIGLERIAAEISELRAVLETSEQRRRRLAQVAAEGLDRAQAQADEAPPPPTPRRQPSSPGRLRE
jgi:transcriptional regulator with XRE-family HTH domain